MLRLRYFGKRSIFSCFFKKIRTFSKKSQPQPNRFSNFLRQYLLLIKFELLPKKVKKTNKIKCLNFSFYGRQETHGNWRETLGVTFASACDGLLTSILIGCQRCRLQGPQISSLVKLETAQFFILYLHLVVVTR